MRLRRWIVGLVAGALVLASAAVLVLTRLVDPDRFKGPLEAAVREATGRPFAIHGRLEVEWFPWLAVRTGRAELGNPPGTEMPPVLAWESMRLGARLVPLLRGRLVIDRVRLDGLRVHLHRAADGRTNWAGLLDGGGSEFTATLIEIGGIEIRDGVISYEDAASPMRIEVSDLSLETGEWRPGGAVPVRARLALAGESGTRIGELELATRLQLTQPTEPSDGSAAAAEQATYTGLRLEDTQLRGTLRGGALPEDGLPIELEVPGASARFADFAIEAPKWQARLAEAEVAGALHVERRTDAWHARGPISVSIPELRRFLARFDESLALRRDPDALGPFALRGEWTYADGVAAVAPVEIRFDQTKLTGELGSAPGEEPAWTFDLHGDRIDFGRYLARDGQARPSEPPLAALRALRARGTLTFDEARLDDTTMKNVRLRVEPAEEERRAAPAAPGDAG